MTELNINNLDEITSFVGTRGQIYELINKYNPLAIIDKRQAYVKIEDAAYLIILKKVTGGFKINIIWRVDSGYNKQYHF